MRVRAYATVTGPAATYTGPDGHTEPITTTADEDIRHAVVRRAADEARRTGTPIELVTRGDRGDHHLVVHTDGTLAPLPHDAHAIDEAPDTAPASALTEEELVAEELELFGKEVRETAPHPEDTSTAAPATDDPLTDESVSDAAPVAEPPTPRQTFLTTPADPDHGGSGWHRFWARLGLTRGGSHAQKARARAVRAVSSQWAGCRTIAVVNGKGGVGKTMTTAMLAAVLARHGGGNVLAWDNNDTRGTLGWRTEPGRYDTTIRDLLRHAPGLLDRAAAVSEIAQFVHHQPDDRYDVLRSNPELLATDQRLTTSEFDLLMQVAARYYRVVVFDSGNDESADRWLRMIDSSYQVVIPTLASPESAESAALLLDALRTRDAHSRVLADNAVVIVTQQEAAHPKDLVRIVDGFAGLVRAVEIIPFDPALKSGPLRWGTLRTRTQDAWLRATATTVITL
ncbi:ParA family protein [Microbacterium sp. NPDC055357]